ncbi:O-antigen ligase [Sphingomonas sp. IBVSS2]|uniref:O-antigen ligase family protein n=1 Tax=Sphingomonas sp. IBVSS2 TaxID=1985172 RepID=UPI001181A727|nr:O-antigen ligase family protein [Sphingomonas sp. IBVSS2]
MTRFPPDRLLRSAHLWVLLGFLVLLVLTGGGARADIPALMVLRPAAALALGFGLWFLTPEEARRYRFLLAYVAAVALVVAIQLVPLPPAIWQALPGRAIVVDVDRAAGLPALWRPISLVSYQTWNALFSLLVPASVLVLCIGVGREQRFLVLPLLIGMGVLGGVLGLMQVIGPPDGPLYFYRITNNGSAVGLFANRNHQAIYLACLFPMLAVYAASAPAGLTLAHRRTRFWLCVGAGLLFLPLLLVTGSRLGLIVGLIGLASIPFLYAPQPDRSASSRSSRRWWYAAGGIAVVALGAFTVFASRGIAVQRLLAGNVGDDARVPLWQTSMTMLGKYFPFGSGFGSFADVYPIDEPDWALRPTYGNHAHNELLEVALTGGILGIALMLVAVLAWAVASWRVFRRPLREGQDVAFGRLASVLMLIFGVASVTDYPLRTPFLAGVLAISAVWLCAGAYPSSRNPSKAAYRAR